MKIRILLWILFFGFAWLIYIPVIYANLPHLRVPANDLAGGSDEVSGKIYGIFVGDYAEEGPLAYRDAEPEANSMAHLFNCFASITGKYGDMEYKIFSKNHRASCETILSSLKDYAEKTTSKDMIVFTYSGHGECCDLSLSMVEFCRIIPYELYAALKPAKSSNAKIYVFLGSCNSGCFNSVLKHLGSRAEIFTSTERCGQFAYRSNKIVEGQWISIAEAKWYRDFCEANDIDCGPPRGWPSTIWNKYVEFISLDDRFVGNYRIDSTKGLLASKWLNDHSCQFFYGYNAYDSLGGEVVFSSDLWRPGYIRGTDEKEALPIPSLQFYGVLTLILLFFVIILVTIMKSKRCNHPHF